MHVIVFDLTGRTVFSGADICLACKIQSMFLLRGITTIVYAY